MSTVIKLPIPTSYFSSVRHVLLPFYCILAVSRLIQRAIFIL